MNPLISKELVDLRQEELHRKAKAQRPTRRLAEPWAHPWRRGLGQQLEHWGQQLQGCATPDRSLSRSTST